LFYLVPSRTITYYIGRTVSYFRELNGKPNHKEYIQRLFVPRKIPWRFSFDRWASNLINNPSRLDVWESLSAIWQDSFKLALSNALENKVAN